jgi:rubrerythrin
MDKSLKGTKTEQNLLKAFAGESQARNRYEFFASVAKKEGYEQLLLSLWKQPVRKRNMPKDSLNFWKVGWWKSLLPILQELSVQPNTNLKAAAEGEYEEWSSLYPTFAELPKRRFSRNFCSIQNGS